VKRAEGARRSLRQDRAHGRLPAHDERARDAPEGETGDAAQASPELEDIAIRPGPEGVRSYRGGIPNADDATCGLERVLEVRNWHELRASTTAHPAVQTPRSAWSCISRANVCEKRLENPEQAESSRTSTSRESTRRTGMRSPAAPLYLATAQYDRAAASSFAMRAEVISVSFFPPEATARIAGREARRCRVASATSRSARLTGTRLALRACPRRSTIRAAIIEQAVELALLAEASGNRSSASSSVAPGSSSAQA